MCEDVWVCMCECVWMCMCGKGVSGYVDTVCGKGAYLRNGVLRTKCKEFLSTNTHL